MKKILIINGPNLNLLGNREDDIYGKDSLDKIKSDCEKKGIEKKLEIIFFQSNNEGEIIDKIHEVNDKFDGLICGFGGNSYLLGIEAIHKLIYK